MRRDWNARARKDAFYYIASWRNDWDIDAFLKSGDADYERLVAPVLRRFDFVAEDKTMVELGCGAGRMTRAFSDHFRGVVATDISGEMLDRAKPLLKDRRNISWTQVDGVELPGIETASLDFAFSYLVLQHLPAAVIVRSYVSEMLRVLRPDGLCLFQFNGTEQPAMNWKGRLAWGAADAIWAVHARGFARFFARALGLDPEMAGRSWHGIAVGGREISEIVESTGGTTLDIWGDGTPMAWCCARKAAV